MRSRGGRQRLGAHPHRACACRARKRGSSAGYRVNAEIPDSLLDASVRAETAARRLLGRAVDHCAVSARTIADLAEEEPVTQDALAEALSYRNASEPDLRLQSVFIHLRL